MHFSYHGYPRAQFYRCAIWARYLRTSGVNSDSVLVMAWIETIVASNDGCDPWLWACMYFDSNDVRKERVG